MINPRKTVAVLGEGITEKYYIQSLRDVLTIKPTYVKPKNSDISELEIKIKDCISKSFSTIFCLIDMDNKVNDGNQDHANRQITYQKLRAKYHNVEFKNPIGSKSLVIMIETFPSTELFLQYYFGYTSRFETNEGLKHDLHNRFGYSTDEKYLIKHSLHDSLQANGGNLKTAIAASKLSVNLRDMRNPHCIYSEIGLMLEFLMLAR